MIDRNTLGIIEKLIWEPYKEDILSIELWGSQILEFLNSKKDIDIIIVCDTFEKSREFRKKLNAKTRASYKHKYNLCINIVYKTKFSDNTLMWSFEWESNYREILFGDKHGRDIRDILKNKKLYINSLRYEIINIILKSKHALDFKNWYWIYTGISILKNNSYELTDIQKANIQVMHDQDISNADYINNIIECLNYLKIDCGLLGEDYARK